MYVMYHQSYISQVLHEVHARIVVEWASIQHKRQVTATRDHVHCNELRVSYYSCSMYCYWPSMVTYRSPFPTAVFPLSNRWHYSTLLHFYAFGALPPSNLGRVGRAQLTIRSEPATRLCS